MQPELPWESWKNHVIVILHSDTSVKILIQVGRFQGLSHGIVMTCHFAVHPNMTDETVWMKSKTFLPYLHWEKRNPDAMTQTLDLHSDALCPNTGSIYK